jgi:TfoX/Sxy family transcriptional regulator of competence genes
MAYNEKLADRIRESLGGVVSLEEKKMFRGVCFLVNDKMCICVGNDEMMCRIGPDHFEEALEKSGVRPMIQRGKVMVGFVYVAEEAYEAKRDFDYWIRLSLEFNKKARASKKRAG